MWSELPRVHPTFIIIMADADLPHPVGLLEDLHALTEAQLGRHFANHVCKAPHRHDGQPAHGKLRGKQTHDFRASCGIPTAAQAVPSARRQHFHNIREARAVRMAEHIAPAAEPCAHRSAEEFRHVRICLQHKITGWRAGVRDALAFQNRP